MSAPMLRQGEDVHEWTDAEGVRCRAFPDGGIAEWDRKRQRWEVLGASQAAGAELVRLSAIVEAARVYEGTREPEDFERLQRLLLEG